jgi:MYXO-CTERM domain-containing protein
MEKPLRFQLVVATLAIGGALAATADPPRPSPAFTFEDPSIDESSGLVDSGSSVLTVNDSGSEPEIYVVDKTTGETVGRTTYTTDEVVDVEALAPGGDGTVWVGDIGDNGARRLSVAVYQVPGVGPGDRTAEATRYDLAYRGGPRDAEALLVHPRTGRLHVVSKGLLGGQVFVAPRTLRTDAVNVLRPVGGAPGLVTDGAFFPDGRHVLLRTYSTMAVRDARSWESEAGAELPDQQQGEGLAMLPSGRRVLVSTEGANSDVLTVPLGGELLDAVAPPTRAEAPARGPSAGPPARFDDSAGTGQVVGGTAAGVAAAGVVLLLWRRRRRQSRSTT